MPIETLRIVESEVSLHPRAIWSHWQKENVVWDPRTYYGILEFIGVLIVLLSFLALNPEGGRFRVNYYIIQQLWTGVFILLAISPLHWFSNHRTSTIFLTRSRSHVAIMLTLVLIITATQVFRFSSRNGAFAEAKLLDFFIWLSIPILLFATYVVYSIVRNPRKDPILAELPSPIDLDDDTSRTPWSNAAVADGIEDDDIEPEGQLRLE
ncbi:hypothetical protein M413DRAFT_447798 [Hebeloma cylindrosporum]|uniref:Uncharacterized protein n=1 Tax=Hebeloma cylindrosporum TaxID=76867 RepID=A0A0C2XLL2_HEBCY|nr:hypothetical protein M413DRAFT_447798 [Hebeloma cylindrosporum h7]